MCAAKNSPVVSHLPETFGSEPSVETIGHVPPVMLPALAVPEVRRGMQILREAYEWALDVGATPHEFAVKITEVRLFGLTISDLRWLVLKGLVETLIETTVSGDAERMFRPIRTLQFPKRTAFVLTPAGYALAKEKSTSTGLALSGRRSQEPIPSVVAVQPGLAVPRGERTRIPHWDADLQELRFDGQVVKQFKVPAPNQEMVLAAFQEEGWPPRVDDPLPPAADQEPKRRLHDTIVSLNRTLKRPLIRFLGDGSGEGVRWTIVREA